MAGSKVDAGILATRGRLTVEIEKRLSEFVLTARLTVGAEIVVLFGPSGAGKSSTLNAIAGLLNPDGGEIRLNGRTLFLKHPGSRTIDVPARHRDVGYVFQNHALFPHLTARQNVAYPLQARRRPWNRRTDERRAIELLERMRMSHLADRYPRELSGGQQQRVAIARALAAGPQVLLPDEPFSALDSAVRERLQADLASLQADLAIPVLYVTHRLEDAFAIGQRLAVMNDGQVVQIGPIAEVFRRPANQDIAEIIGIRNLFRARVVETSPGGLVLDWAGLRMEASVLETGGAEEEAEQLPAVGSVVAAYIRPEEIKILYPDRPVTAAVAHNRVVGVIRDFRLATGYRQVQVELPNGAGLEVRFPASGYSSLELQPGATVLLSLRRTGLVVLPERRRTTSNPQPTTSEGSEIPRA